MDLHVFPILNPPPTSLPKSIIVICDMIGFLANAMGIIKSQYVNVPNQHIVYLKLTQNFLLRH